AIQGARGTSTPQSQPSALSLSPFKNYSRSNCPSLPRALGTPEGRTYQRHTISNGGLHAGVAGARRPRAGARRERAVRHPELLRQAAVRPPGPGPGPDHGTTGAGSPSEEEGAQLGRARPRPAGPPRRRRRLGHRAARPRRLHRQRRRPSPDTEQLRVQERGAPGGRERRGGAHLPRALLQPQGRRPHRPGAGAGGGREPAGALPDDDLRRVQALRQEQGRQGQGADRGSQGPGNTRKSIIDDD
ncbi:jasmonate-regulated gene 21, partial [Zea mays]